MDIRGISKDTKDYYSEYDYKKGQLNLNSIEINRCIEFQNELKRRFQNELLFILRDN